MRPVLQSILVLALFAGLWLALLPLPLVILGVLAAVWLPRLAASRSAPVAAGHAAEAGQIDRLARELSQRTSRNALSAAGVAYAVRRLGERLHSQLDAAERIVASADVMLQTEALTSERSQQAEAAAIEARRSSEAGYGLLGEATAVMQQLSERAEASRATIEALSQRSEQIQQVTQVIQGIASQTNLLALNAAIEAARAGEHGRGFAVVADEVRGLAARTAAATEEVGQMVVDIQQRTAGVVEQIQMLTSELDRGVRQVERIGGHLSSITELAVTVEGRISEIAAATQVNREQLGSLFAAVEQVRADLSESEEQTRRLGQAAAELGAQAESISERLAEIGLDDYHQRVYDLAREGAAQIAARFEADIAAGPIALDDLFDRHYQPIPGTQPTKYRSRFDGYTDQVLPAIQEPLLKRHEGLVFAIACTEDGYVPTHNLAFSAPPSGDPAIDTAKSRSKRLFNDRTGIRCGSHRQPLLLQTYTRDTGELMHDLSVPIFVHGRHWGGLRLGYRPESAGEQA